MGHTHTGTCTHFDSHTSAERLSWFLSAPSGCVLPVWNVISSGVTQCNRDSQWKSETRLSCERLLKWRKDKKKKSIIEWFSANFYRAETQRGTTEYCQGTGWQWLRWWSSLTVNRLKIYISLTKNNFLQSYCCFDTFENFVFIFNMLYCR